nr:hypothetical protein [Tanacetum cinerariifolium]
MSQATSLLQMRTEEELVPKDEQVGTSTSNVMIDVDAVFTNTLHQLAIAILKTHIIYNSLTLTAMRRNADIHRSEMDERYKPAKVAKRGVIYYGLQIPDTMLNDTIQEMDAYKEYAESSQRVIVPIVQPQPLILPKERIRILKPKGNPVPKEKTSSKDKPEKETLVKGKRLKVVMDTIKK